MALAPAVMEGLSALAPPPRPSSASSLPSPPSSLEFELLQGVPLQVLQRSYDLSLQNFDASTASALRRFSSQPEHAPVTALQLLDRSRGVIRPAKMACPPSSELSHGSSAAPAPAPAPDAPFRPPAYVTTSLTSLDRLLTTSSPLPSPLPSLVGGFKAGQVSELLGQAGVGKTNLCMQCAIAAVSAGGRVVYIDTEKKFSVPRLADIAAKLHGSSREMEGGGEGGGGEDYDDGFQYPQDLTKGGDGNSDTNANGKRPLPSSRASHNAVSSDSTSASASSSSNSSFCKGLRPDLKFLPVSVILSRIIVHTPDTIPELLSVIESLSSSSSSSLDSASLPPITLIVLDSLASLVSRNFDTGLSSAPSGGRSVSFVGADRPPPSSSAPSKSLPDQGLGNISRADALFKSASSLKKAAALLSCAVVVTNQIVSTAVVAAAQPSSSSSSEHPLPGVEVTAALGNSWHHSVSVRLLMEYTSEVVVGGGHGGEVFGVRRATVAKSADVKKQSIKYVIRGGGIDTID